MLLARMPVGSVVSFMLPNWHEAAVIYLGATLAGMVVNPILPSLRDHELTLHPGRRDSRMIFIPGDFRGHDYPAMLTRVCAAAHSPGGGGGPRRPANTPYRRCSTGPRARHCRSSTPTTCG